MQAYCSDGGMFSLELTLVSLQHALEGIKPRYNSYETVPVGERPEMFGLA